MRSRDTIYRVTRTPQGVRAFVVEANASGGYDMAPLPHLVKHSPSGFEYGYPGSGPADLARSIIGHLFETDDPSPAAYQAFKTRTVAAWADDRSHEITAGEIVDAMTGTHITYLHPKEETMTGYIRDLVVYARRATEALEKAATALEALARLGVTWEQLEHDPAAR